MGRLIGAGAVGVAVLPSLGDAPGAEAKKKRAEAEHNIRGNKTIMCIDGETRRVPKKKRKKYLKRGATRGKCQDTCTPVCPAGSCGGDGCGGSCPGCGAGTVCAEGVCQMCTVRCDGTSAQCGKDLALALVGGGDISICPGTYGGPFAVDTATRMYGAGSGADPVANTILDGQGLGSTVMVADGLAAKFAGLRVINGLAAAGGGIFGASGSRLTVADCVIDGNTASDGGGVFFAGTLDMSKTQVTNNEAYPDGGGGISGSTAMTETSVLRNCLISRNGAALGAKFSGSGGGIALVDVNMDIIGTEINSNTGRYTGGVAVNASNGTPRVTIDATSKVTGNTVYVHETDPTVRAGGIYNDGGTVTVNGATVSGNTDPQCAGGVTGC